MFIFGHTCLVFKDPIKTYFYGIYVILCDLIDIKKTSFQSSNPSLTALAVDRTVDRPSGRSTGTVDRCARDVHKGQPIRSIDRAVGRLKAPHSRVGAGRPGGDRWLWPSRPGVRPEAQRSKK